LLCEYPDLQSSDSELWGQVLAAAVTLGNPDVDKQQQKAAAGTGGDDDDEDDPLQLVTGEAAFSKLHFAGRGAKEHDWFPNIPDATIFLAQELHQLVTTTTTYPGQYQAIIQKSLDPPKMEALNSYLAKAGKIW